MRRWPPSVLSGRIDGPFDDEGHIATVIFPKKQNVPPFTFISRGELPFFYTIPWELRNAKPVILLKYHRDRVASRFTFRLSVRVFVGRTWPEFSDFQLTRSLDAKFSGQIIFLLYINLTFRTLITLHLNVNAAAAASVQKIL